MQNLGDTYLTNTRHVERFGFEESCSMSITDQEIIPKLGTKTEVWQYFGLLIGPNGQAIDDGSAYCKLCRKKVLAKSGNTSNLKAHLKNNHKTVYCQLQKPSAPIPKVERMPVITPLTQALPYGHLSKWYKELNEAVAYFICKDGLPSTLWRSLDFDRWLRNWIVGMKFSVVLTSQDS